MADVTKKATSPVKIVLIILGVVVVSCALLAVAGFLLFNISSSSTVFDSIIKTSEIKCGDEYGCPITLDEVYSGSLVDKQVVIVYGQVRLPDGGSNYFELVDGDYQVNIQYADLSQYGLKDLSLSDINEGDHVMVEAQFDATTWGLYARDITKTTAEKIESYEKSQIQMLEVEILEYPTAVAHTCRHMEFKLKLKNTGSVPIDLANINNSSGRYNLRFSVNDNVPAISYALETEGYIFYLDLAVKDSLKPNESITVTFGAGGMVTENLDPTIIDDDGGMHTVGIAAERNILDEYPNTTTGSKEIQFHWTLNKDKNDTNVSYTNPKYLSSSNKITVDLLSAECDMNDIQRTVVLSR